MISHPPITDEIAERFIQIIFSDRRLLRRNFINQLLKVRQTNASTFPTAQSKPTGATRHRGVRGKLSHNNRLRFNTIYYKRPTLLAPGLSIFNSVEQRNAKEMKC